MKSDSYLIVAPDRPTQPEMLRGAKPIPSMLDEGALVWRVPRLGAVNKLGQSPLQVMNKLRRWCGDRDAARAVAWKLLLRYRRQNNEDMVEFYGYVLSGLTLS
jgi:hypothetical protein